MTLIKNLGTLLIFLSTVYAAAGDRIITIDTPRMSPLQISIRFNIMGENYEAHSCKNGQVCEGSIPLFTGYDRPKIMDLKKALKEHDPQFYGLLKEGILVSETDVLDGEQYTILSEEEYLVKEIDKTTWELDELKVRLAAIRVGEVR